VSQSRDDKSGVIISSPWLFRIAADAAVATPEPSPTSSMAPGLTAVVFAAASVEALINEVAELADIEVRLGYEDVRLRTFVEAIYGLESSRGSTQLKFVVASALLGDRPYQRGAQPYQDFALLMSLRNAVMHLKATTIHDVSNGEWRLGAETVLEKLRARKLVDPARPHFVTMLLSEASRPQVARWAVNAAAAMALSFISFFPEPFRTDILSDQSEVFQPLPDMESR